MVLVTGGAGFIGSNFVLNWLKQYNEPILNVDKLTYAGNVENLSSVANNPLYSFCQMDICDQEGIRSLLIKHKPRAIINFAAESHVDRSIHGPADFIKTNIVGTFSLLQASLEYWDKLPDEDRMKFRFLHVSTDEVYGSLEKDDEPFTESHQYLPNSPYSASKASSDHLVRAYHHTYGLPVLTTNCSNNYGPFQFPEKLIPVVIHNALNGRNIPIYGDGSNIRDWLYVIDHCEAIIRVLFEGKVGETYNVGGKNEMRNLDVVDSICEILDELSPRADGRSYKDQKTFVRDRPGHDKRYAIGSAKIEKELGWFPKEDFTSGIRKTVQWYLENQNWVTRITTGVYREWINKNYGERA